MKKYQKGFTPIAILLIVILLAGGIYLISKNFGTKNLFSVVSNSPTPPTVDTKDWKTYDNSGFGYVTKYPANWSFSGDQNSNPLTTSLATFQSDSTCNVTNNLCSIIQIDVENNSDKNDLTPILAVNLEGPNPDKITNKSSVKINGENASEFDLFEASLRSAAGTLIHTVVVNHNGRKYVLSFLESSFGGGSIVDSTKWKNKYVFDQILSTFKFTQ